MAVYAIGDIQGCYDPFRELLDLIDFDPATDCLWLTGDLVNRGPRSLKTLRFVKSLGDSAITVLGNHDLHLLALAEGNMRFSERFESLQKVLTAADRDELIHWLRHRPLAHYDKRLGTLLVHAGTHPKWSVRKTLARAAEVESVLRSGKYGTLLDKMYGNRPNEWSAKLKGYSRLRFIINCLTRMRMLTPDMRLNFSYSGAPGRARKKLVPWYAVENAAWSGTRVVFGHWSALGLIVLPDLLAIDTGCVWGRQLTAVRLDKRIPRVYQVRGQT
ncbi:MAG: symmetrical bis(5'-nucleosyl)-tetraphosphatase [Gammaproteobacteria bacterium]|nr:symmetrical bis(5'-nucleosyl)-tetraphosphatase [Gammaproteobacteria bacterium]